MQNCPRGHTACADLIQILQCSERCTVLQVARHKSDRVWDHVHYLNKEIKGLQHKIDATEREVLQAILAKKPDRYIACLKEEQNRLIYVRNVRLDQVVRLRDALAGEVPCCCPTLQVQ